MRAIITSENYADEFDYPIVSFFSKKDVKEIKKLIKAKKFKMKEEREFYFGTNECLTLTGNEILEMIESAPKISKEDYALVEKLGFIALPSLDIVDRFRDILEDE